MKCTELILFVSKNAERIALRLGKNQDKLIHDLDAIIDWARHQGDVAENQVQERITIVLQQFPVTESVLAEFQAAPTVRALDSGAANPQQPIVGRQIRQRCEILVRHILGPKPPELSSDSEEPNETETEWPD